MFSMFFINKIFEKNFKDLNGSEAKNWPGTSWAVSSRGSLTSLIAEMQSVGLSLLHHYGE